MKKLLTICLIMATAFTINAQTQPTKEETISWLNEKLKNNLDVNRRSGIKWDVSINILVNECEIFVAYNYTWEYSNCGKITEYYELTIPTQNLKIFKIDNDGYFDLDYEAIKETKTKSIRPNYCSSPDVGVPKFMKTTYGIRIIFTEENLEERIEKALAHLATFCPEKKKETF